MLIHNLNSLSQLVFEVTDACNLKCKYCAFSDLYTGYDERKNKYLSFGQAKKIIDYLVNFWKENSSDDFPKRLNIGFYGGEPLLNFKLIKEVIAYLESLGDFGRTLSYSMTTNGTLLDKYIDYLVEKKFNLLVSLDGDESAQGFRVYHNGCNSFGDVYDNVCMVREKYPAYFDQHVSFNSVLHSKNNIGRVYEFFQSNFSKTPRISPLSDSGVNQQTTEEFENICNDYAQDFNRLTDATAEKIANTNFQLSPKLNRFHRSFEMESGNIYADFHELVFNKCRSGYYPTGTCLPFSKKMYITVNGKIMQCERIDHEHFFGRITDKGIELDFDKITEDHNENMFKYITQCEGCATKRRCPVCIYRVDDFYHTPDCADFTPGSKRKLELELLRENPHILEKVYQIKTVQ